MNKKILITIVILVAIIALLGIYIIHVHKPIPTKEQLTQRFSEFEIQYDEKKAQGYDVTEADEFARKAKQAFDGKDYRAANKFLDEAFEALEEKIIPMSFVPSVWISEGPIYETHPYYYDGTFKGLTEKIPSIADLGIKTLYLMPIWEQPLGEEEHFYVYHIKDYYKIDPVYGTPQELKELIDTAHKYNMKVLFDLVTCCTWEDSTIWNKNGTFSIPLSELKKEAEELGWTLKYETVDGDRYVYSNCIKKDRLLCELAGMIVEDEVILHHYPSAGWGFAVDRTNPEVIKYFTEVAEYYVKEYDIDGWRVDAPLNNWNPNIVSGGHSIQELLKSVRKAITNVKPDAILLSESPSIFRRTGSELPDPVLDEVSVASYSYYFYHKREEIMREKNPQQLMDILANEKIWHNRTRIRFLDTHDTKRINKIAPPLNKPLLVLISTILGIPIIQAGQEIGATNIFFYNPEVDWDNGDYELREFYKKVFEIRNSHPALKYGTISNVWKSGDTVYAYLREYENENVIVLINFQNKTTTSFLDLSFLDRGTVLYDELNDEKFVVDEPSNFQISVSTYGSRILILKGDR